MLGGGRRRYEIGGHGIGELVPGIEEAAERAWRWRYGGRRPVERRRYGQPGRRISDGGGVANPCEERGLAAVSDLFRI